MFWSLNLFMPWSAHLALYMWLVWTFVNYLMISKQPLISHYLSISLANSLVSISLRILVSSTALLKQPDFGQKTETFCPLDYCISWLPRPLRLIQEQKSKLNRNIHWFAFGNIGVYKMKCILTLFTGVSFFLQRSHSSDTKFNYVFLRCTCVCVYDTYIVVSISSYYVLTHWQPSFFISCNVSALLGTFWPILIYSLNVFFPSYFLLNAFLLLVMES